MKHVFKATKIGWDEEKEGVWFHSDDFTKEEAEAEFKPYKGTTQKGYPYTGYEFDGQKYYDFIYLGEFEDDEAPHNDEELFNVLSKRLNEQSIGIEKKEGKGLTRFLAVARRIFLAGTIALLVSIFALDISYGSIVELAKEFNSFQGVFSYFMVTSPIRFILFSIFSAFFIRQYGQFAAFHKQKAWIVSFF